jgi:hypothetical protein
MRSSFYVNSFSKKLRNFHSIVSECTETALSYIPYGDYKVPFYFKEPTVKELVYYGLFIAAAHGSHLIFEPLIGDPAAYLFTFITGSILQGNPHCIHQKNIEREYPIISAITGGLNAFIGCKSFSVLNNVIGIVPGFAVDTCLSAIVMCKVEEKIRSLLDTLHSKYNVNDNHNDNKCCCSGTSL